MTFDYLIYAWRCHILHTLSHQFPLNCSTLSTLLSAHFRFLFDSLCACPSIHFFVCMIFLLYLDLNLVYIFWSNVSSLKFLAITVSWSLPAASVPSLLYLLQIQLFPLLGVFQFPINSSHLMMYYFFPFVGDAMSLLIHFVSKLGVLLGWGLTGLALTCHIDLGKYSFNLVVSKKSSNCMWYCGDTNPVLMIGLGVLFWNNSWIALITLLLCSSVAICLSSLFVAAWGLVHTPAIW